MAVTGMGPATGAGEAVADRTVEVIDALRGDGWCQRPDFFDAATVAALRADALDLRADFRAASVGRAQTRQRQADIRSDATRWLDGASAAQRTFLAAMEQLRLALNSRLYLGLFDFEAHYAHYPPGAFYRRHCDVFRAAASDGKPRRVLSAVFYLNDAWCEGDGGELLLWDDADRAIARIAPLGGSAVFFLSDEIPHEVLPARADRYSIAGWFRAAGDTA
jgi:SM-20-related protein